MSRLITDRHDDARIARAWTAFAREDAATRAPAGLEARVLQAARSAIAERRRAQAERQRRRWIAGSSAIAASMLAAAGWVLSMRTPPAVSTTATSSQAAATRTGATGAGAAPSAASPGSSAPMTNVEAGRMLATPPQALLASRPLFDGADAGVVGIRGLPRAHAYHAPIVEPAPYARTQAAPPGRDGAPRPDAPGPAAAPGSEAWAAREAAPLFDPDAAEPAPVYRLDKTAPGPAPHEDPPPPPKP